MATKKKGSLACAQTAAAPVTPLKIDGKTYSLSFTFEGLAAARVQLRELGVRVNLLQSLNTEDMDADTLPPLLFGATRECHEELTYADIKRLVRFDTYGAIFAGLCSAYIAAMRTPEGEPSGANPPASK